MRAGSTKNNQREGIQRTPILCFSKVKLARISHLVQRRDRDEKGEAHGVIVSVNMRLAAISQA